MTPVEIEIYLLHGLTFAVLICVIYYILVR